MTELISKKHLQLDISELQHIYRAFHEAGRELYLVGGAVRDLALGRPLTELDDLDFCTDARPQESLEILKRNKFSTYEMGIEFGTVGAVIRGPKDRGYPKDCQVTTYRSAEFYRRGSRHPEVSFGDTIDQDLWRRDFSINSIAMDSRGRFVDPYDGLGDLSRRVLRVVSDPNETLAEDPLRILRVGRFISKLGFKPADSLTQAARARAEHILDISRERWLQEMTKLLQGPNATRALEFLREVHILTIILPELHALWSPPHQAPPDEAAWRTTCALLSAAPVEASSRWAALLAGLGRCWCRPDAEAAPDGSPPRHATHAMMQADAILARFKADNELRANVMHLLAHQDLLSELPAPHQRPDVRRLAHHHGQRLEITLDFLESQATILDDGGESKRALEALRVAIGEERASDTLLPKLPAGVGKAVIDAFGLKPSPIVGQIKDYLEAQILNGTLENGQGSDYYVRSLRLDPPDFLPPTHQPS
jgi:poly(A) polymerase